MVLTAKRAKIGVLLAILLAASFQLGRTVTSADPGDLNIRRLEYSAVTELEDDRKLVGLADNVFIGEVVRKLGQTTDGPVPETQYAVNVQKAIKGTLSGEVVVNQQGGFLPETNELILIDGDALIEPGQTYLFATLTNDVTGWHTVIPGYGDLQVRSAQNRDELRARFSAARQNQIPLAGRENRGN